MKDGKSAEDKSASIHYLLHFLGQSVEYRGGKKMSDLIPTINLIIQLIDQEMSEEVMTTLSQIGAVLLLSKNFLLAQLDASRLAKKILNIDHKSVFESFVINSIEYSQFDVLILPDFLKYFERNFSKESLEILAKIIKKRSLNDSLDVENWKCFSITLKNSNTIKEISKFVDEFEIDSDEKIENYLLAIQCFPHLVTNDKNSIEKQLEQQLKDICGMLKKNDGAEKEKFLYILAESLTALYHIKETMDKKMVMEVVTVLLPSVKSGSAGCFSSLKLLHFLLQILLKQNPNLLSAKLFERIHLELVDNLLSAHHEVRQLTSKVLALFDHLKLAGGNEDEPGSIYSIFSRIEGISPSIHTYRDQILLLQKLNYDATYFRDVKDTPYVEDSMKFCMGFLNVNFQLLWEPTQVILDSYAEGFTTDLYWKIFNNQLVLAAYHNQEAKPMEDEEESFLNDNEFLMSNFEEFGKMRVKSDPINYRVKLWQMLSESKINIQDVKHKDIVELFMNFISDEYEYEEEVPEDDETENKKDQKEAPKARQKLLIGHLQVFARMNNPKYISKEAELRELYISFLLHRNFIVQRLSLDCIMQYKDSWLIDYKDVLYNSLNEKTFRQELMALKLSEKVREDHRDGFIAVFLPIIYSKMTTKVFKKDQEAFRNKKEVITRFLINLTEPEMIKLTNIAILKIAPFVDENPQQILENVTSSKVGIRVNLLQSMLNFVDLIKKHVAGLFSVDYQRKILRSILAISCFTKNSNDTMFKNLKQACLASLVNFFEHFESFPWEQSELDLLYELFIWSHLETFSCDGSQNITGLMKLFVQWSKNPQNFHLLRKSQNDADVLYPLKSIIELLSNKNSSLSVNECVMDMLERLLTLKKDEDEISQDVNYGTKIIQPFIHEILLKLKEYLNNRRIKHLNQRNLLILSRVTELVTSEESSKILLDILFPLTLKRTIDGHADTESIMKLMNTISNLLKSIKQPKQYLKLMAPLFEQIQEVSLRKFLLKIFNQMLRAEDRELKYLIQDLNAYDRRWIEQPDHEKRLTVFHKLDNIMETQKMTLELAVLIIYHCFYFLKYEKDLAIRDNASHYLKLVCLNVIKQCGSDKTQMDYFVDKIVLNLIQKRIRDSEPRIRTESILLLGELSRKCPDVHPVFRDLHPLCDDKNRELDFFDNITHLQKFRHMKALRRFPEIAKEYTIMPNQRTLNDFLLPISRIFICSEEFQRKSKIIEAAIEFVAAVCRFLPWTSYESLLKFYVRKMKFDLTYQKQLIRLMPAILDAFHFDLSAANGEIAEVEEELPEEEDEENAEENAEDAEEGEDVEMEVEEEEEEIKPIDEITILRPNVARRVTTVLARRLIPSLFKIINEQMSSDAAHKLNKENRRSKEKADMLRIPIALPIVKLLQKLPEKFLSEHLSQLIIKISSYLRSTLKQVRGLARHTIKEILVTLGPSYLELIVSHLSAVLNKGFQVHVCSVTIHTLMDSMKDQLTDSKKVDNLLQIILNICLDDIFGKLSEEQEVGKIARRTPEAKPSKKSFLTLGIMASKISEKCVLDLLIPFKNYLLETQSKKTVIKIQECLQRIVSGLASNENLTMESLMVLVYGTVSESIPDLLPEIKKKNPNNGRTKLPPNDSFLIAEEPKRRGALTINKAVRSNKQTNSYVLVEFGLELLHVLLKKKKSQEDYTQFLNPIVQLLKDSLRSNYLRVIMFSIKCLTIMWHYELDLEQMTSNIEPIVKEVFGILHKYASNEVSKKDNHYLLVKNTFKCVVTLLKQVPYYSVNENQLKALLLYVEQDLFNHDKDTMAFTLLKSILDRKLLVPELHDIVKKVAEISVTSELDERRSVTRPIVLTYLMEYPVGKKIEGLLKFFIAQFNYEEISGRESAILMMILIFRHFPQVLLRKFSGLFFLSLGTRLVNDESPECREKLAEALELLIKQLDNNPRQQMYDVVLVLLKDSMLIHREMAAQLCIRFVNAEGKEFVKRIPAILPLLVGSLTNVKSEDEMETETEVGKFVRIKQQQYELDQDDEETTNEQTGIDHHLIQTMSAIIAIYELNEGTIKDEAFRESVNAIGYHCQYLISHDHIWVRLRALKIINLMVKSLDMKEIQEIILKNEEVERTEDDNRLFLHAKSELRAVVFDMVVQIKPEVDSDLLAAIMENLLEISNIITCVPIEDKVNDKRDFNLLWLIRRLRYSIHAEIAMTPALFPLRKTIFLFIESLVAIINKETMSKLASSVLTPLMREMVEGEHVIDELKQVAIRVGNKVKSKIGHVVYDQVRVELQSKMLRKRVDRRKALAQDKINNPVKAATRAIFKQLKKTEVKKRKRQSLQDGIFLPKKRRVFGPKMTDTYE